VETLSSLDDAWVSEPKGGRVIKRMIAALGLALTIIPIAASAASAQPDRVGCLFYQTFREREMTDCL
jgi:hypothetical protein